MEGKDKETILALEDAVENGFKDIARLENDTVFMNIKTDDAFKMILKKINESGMSASALN